MLKVDIYILKEKLDRTLDDYFQKGMLSPEFALDYMIQLYSSHQITVSGTVLDESDRLLFQYGVYDWCDGKGERFELNFTRQIADPNPAIDEFFQIGLTLYYSSKDMEHLKPFNFWYNDTSSIKNWKTEVRATEGFTKASDWLLIGFLVEVNQT